MSLSRASLIRSGSTRARSPRACASRNKADCCGNGRPAASVAAFLNSSAASPSWPADSRASASGKLADWPSYRTETI